jgi:16S rRNA G966 N2-methylase RsmD
LRDAIPFDVILLDPPYAASSDFEPVLAAAGEILAPGGVVVLEHARRAAAPEKAGRILRVREQPAGDSALAFYEVKTLCLPSPSTPAPSTR